MAINRQSLAGGIVSGCKRSERKRTKTPKAEKGYCSSTPLGVIIARYPLAVQKIWGKKHGYINEKNLSI